MKMAEELQRELRSINRKSYPAYKGLKGAYQFPDYQLFIEHVQGDPFAAPSALRIFVPHSKAKFPERYYWDKCSKVALQDALLRRFAEISAKFCYQAKGSGKSGVIQVSHCGQEVLERTACEITKEGIHIRFFVGFPANGRTINSGELEKILFVYLPKCVEMSLYHRKVLERETEQVICLKEDQRVIREELKKRGLIAFVANGSILPRQSGNSDLPMKDAVPFQSPKSMEITIQLRHRGSITGMGIRKGITLIAGGGYHGKSTLLEALEKGVYDHIAGDGREFVITDDTAWKLRAEDGRKIKDVDISLFINHLPNGRNTRRFSTLDASGSTSQAANIIEAIEAKSQVLLIDEDTSATNFMVRAELIGQHLNRRKQTDRRQFKRIETDRADHADHGIDDELQQKDAQKLIEHIRLTLPLVIRIRLIQTKVRRHRHNGKQRGNAPQLALELRAKETIGIKRGDQADEHGQNLGEYGKKIIVIRHAADDALDIHGRSPFCNLIKQISLLCIIPRISILCNLFLLFVSAFSPCVLPRHSLYRSQPPA